MQIQNQTSKTVEFSVDIYPEKYTEISALLEEGCKRLSLKADQYYGLPEDTFEGIREDMTSLQTEICAIRDSKESEAYIELAQEVKALIEFPEMNQTRSLRQLKSQLDMLISIFANAESNPNLTIREKSKRYRLLSNFINDLSSNLVNGSSLPIEYLAEEDINKDNSEIYSLFKSLYKLANKPFQIIKYYNEIYQNELAKIATKIQSLNPDLKIKYSAFVPYLSITTTTKSAELKVPGLIPYIKSKPHELIISPESIKVKMPFSETVIMPNKYFMFRTTDSSAKVLGLAKPYIAIRLDKSPNLFTGISLQSTFNDSPDEITKISFENSLPIGAELVYDFDGNPKNAIVQIGGSGGQRITFKLVLNESGNIDFEIQSTSSKNNRSNIEDVVFEVVDKSIVLRYGDFIHRFPLRVNIKDYLEIIILNSFNSISLNQ